MKLVLLVLAFIGAASAICPGKQNPPGVTEPDPYVDGGSTVFQTFEDDSCSSRTGTDGSMQTSSSWASQWGAVSWAPDCTPPGYGECWVLSTACEAKLATFCGSQYAWKSKAPKALKVWWIDQGGKTPSFPIGPVVGVLGVIVFLCVIMWLANCFAKSSCGEPTCPSPLFKNKPPAPTAKTETPV
jgi:hypothetical protein